MFHCLQTPSHQNICRHLLKKDSKLAPAKILNSRMGVSGFINKCVPWDYVCVSHVLLTWAGGARGGSGSGGPSASTHQQGLLVFSQRLLGQVTLPLDLQLQRLGHVGYDPVDGSKHKENHVLEDSRDISPRG